MSRNSQDLEAYVRSSADLLSLPLDAAQVARVADHLSRTVAMAALLEACDLPVEDEPASLYWPAPYPDAARP
ncbi:DUF4089 domain-containing protein [Corticibacter populi]|uniref:DUF4089 domain-containing protein n=1 Tax=Corticibacter populi TaxID=1550736 RepID=A0A3M6QP37_9BURK|nr:DUF4089 domain-containing protein [Corticibacter populi]RMX04818.1 DUF4089 domain-containing protein [Corticibacter populi]RZS33764.1 uncharacterized protein DUF4089 [Corticibacter populi]